MNVVDAECKTCKRQIRWLPGTPQSCVNCFQVRQGSHEHNGNRQAYDEQLERLFGVRKKGKPNNSSSDFVAS